MSAAAPKERLRVVTKSVEDGMFISNEQLARINPDLGKARRAVRLLMADQREPVIHRGPTEKPADVRIATSSDEQAVYDLVVMDLEENASKIAPVCPEDVIAMIRLGTRARGGIVGVIDGPDGKPVAVQILLFQKWWWSRATFIQKMMDFVHPDHRHSTHAAHLIQFAKWVSDYMTSQSGILTYLLSGVLGTRRTPEKTRLYGRYMTSVGGAFLYPYPLPWE